MGTIDKAIRILFAVAIIVLWKLNIISGTWTIVLLALAGIFVLTSLVGVCPLYLPFRFSTLGSSTKSKVDFKSLVRNGATIVDVRSAIEFGMGHLQQSMNIPLEDLDSNLNRLPGKSKAVILCCASGIRSQKAFKKLRSLGYSQLYDGGSWMQLKGQLQ